MACLEGDCDLEKPECIEEIAMEAIFWYMRFEEDMRREWEDGTWGEYVTAKWRERAK